MRISGTVLSSFFLLVPEFHVVQPGTENPMFLAADEDKETDNAAKNLCQCRIHYQDIEEE